jgi:2-polyprenyl-6-methoxyphenol hydroxylase-like FAD-dependent oxidoreductase
MQQSVDVLVVGAGPVGLLLATELARDGVDAMVIERLPRRSPFCKALGVTARTLEIFDDLNIADEAIDAGMWLTGIHAWRDGVLADTISIPAGPLPYGVLSLPQYETERILEAGLHRHGGAVRYGWTLVELQPGTDGVQATIDCGDGSARTLACRWVVGCDGAHSKVRAALGLPFEGGQYPQTFVLADCDVDWKLARGPMHRFTWSSKEERATTGAVAVPVPGNRRRYRLSAAFDADVAEVPGGAPTLAMVEKLILPSLPAGTRLSSLRWSSVYRISHRIVPHYGEGPMLLAGDAAHIHPPVGGQGMNTGLQDAHNLAWKLALVARGLAAPSLLASYTRERQPVGMEVVERTTAAMDGVFARKALSVGMRETQLWIHYRDSPLVKDELAQPHPTAPVPGERAPDVCGLQQAYVGRPRRLHERVGKGRHVLIGYIDPAQTDGLLDMLHVLRAALGRHAEGLAIVPSGAGLPPPDSVHALTDASGQFAETFGALRGMVWLLRPDGHLGWRGHLDAGPDGVNRYLAGIGVGIPAATARQ